MPQNNFFLIIIFILPLGFMIWWMKKRKDKSSQMGSGYAKKRHEGDEVWKTIKDYLKTQNEKGKEIIETYVAKRPDPNYINRSLPKNEQKAQKLEIQKRKKQEKEQIKQLKKEGKKYIKEKTKELYVVLFVTRNPKTLEQDKPRAIECEVKNVRIPGAKKGNTEKKIIILGERDYEVESKWILPIKSAEEQKIKKEYEKQEKFNKYNPIKIILNKRKESIEKNPEKKAKLEKKIEEKERKKIEKKERENKKWEKKETVVKTKK